MVWNRKFEMTLLLLLLLLPRPLPRSSLPKLTHSLRPLLLLQWPSSMGNSMLRNSTSSRGRRSRVSRPLRFLLRLLFLRSESTRPTLLLLLAEETVCTFPLARHPVVLASISPLRQRERGTPSTTTATAALLPCPRSFLSVSLLLLLLQSLLLSLLLLR